MTEQTTAQPGWYPDPYQQGAMRWFDGAAWTAHTAPLPGQAQMGQQTVLAGNRVDTVTGPDSALHWLVPVGRAWQAVLAGYLAIIGIPFFFLGPLVLAMGLWALVAINGGGRHGRGRAWFAVVVGALGTVALLGLIVF